MVMQNVNLVRLTCGRAIVDVASQAAPSDNAAASPGRSLSRTIEDLTLRGTYRCIPHSFRCHASDADRTRRIQALASQQQLPVRL